MKIELELSDQIIEQLAAAIVGRLRPVILDLKAPAPKADDLMSVAQLAEYLGSSKDSIYRQTAANEIPFLRVGRLVRFRRSDIDQWLAKRYIPDVAALSAPPPPGGRGIRNRVLQEKPTMKTPGCRRV